MIFNLGASKDKFKSHPKLSRVANTVSLQATSIPVPKFHLPFQPGKCFLEIPRRKIPGQVQYQWTSIWLTMLWTQQWSGSQLVVPESARGLTTGKVIGSMASQNKFDMHFYYISIWDVLGRFSFESRTKHICWGKTAVNLNGPKAQKRTCQFKLAACLLSMCRSGITATGNFIRRGSLINPSDEKHELIDQTKHSSSLFITAPSPWIVKPTSRLNFTSVSRNIGCEDHGGKLWMWDQNVCRSFSVRFPRSSELNAKLDPIVAIACRISCGAKTLTGTVCTLVELICKPNLKV